MIAAAAAAVAAAMRRRMWPQTNIPPLQSRLLRLRSNSNRSQRAKENKDARSIEAVSVPLFSYPRHLSLSVFLSFHHSLSFSTVFFLFVFASLYDFCLSLRVPSVHL
jgi:hypothetical protein